MRQPFPLPLVLADLDDTLFQTERKCPGAERPHLVLAATAGNGRHSFMTRQQKALVDWLLATAEFVPVTARGSGAFASVSIPFRHGAVVANGAVILGADGTPLAGWDALVRPRLTARRAQLDAVLADGRMRAGDLGLDVRSWLVEENGLATYAVFKENPPAEGGGLAALAGAMPAPRAGRATATATTSPTSRRTSRRPRRRHTSSGAPARPTRHGPCWDSAIP